MTGLAEAPNRVERAATAAAIVLGLAVVARLWAMPLPSSLWLDEFGTVWVTDAGLGQILERSRLFPQSIPYAAVVAGTRAVLGSSEAALRLPSLLAMLVAVRVLFRMVRDSLGRSAGLLAAGTWLLFPQVEFAAGDARPYAFAVLFAALASWSLWRWQERGRFGDAAAYAACAAATVYFQYLFATLLAAHGLYVLWRRRRGSPVSWRPIAATGSALVVLLLPAARLVVEIGGNRARHAFGTLPGAGELFQALVPTRVLGLLAPALLVVFATRLARGWRVQRPAASGLDAIVLFVLSAAIPPLVLFGIARVAATPVFDGRYLIVTAPAWAALFGWLLDAVEPPAGRAATIAVALALALVLRGDFGRRGIVHGREDWRGAVAALDAAAGPTPVFLSGTFAESKDPGLLSDPRHRDYLAAPLEYYRPLGPVQLLPLRAVEGAEAYAPGPTTARFAVVERSSRYPSWTPWLENRGWTAREVFRSPALSVRVFERRNAGG